MRKGQRYERQWHEKRNRLGKKGKEEWEGREKSFCLYFRIFRRNYLFL
jgi:hypothetical protein